MKMKVTEEQFVKCLASLAVRMLIEMAIDGDLFMLHKRQATKTDVHMNGLVYQKATLNILRLTKQA